MPDVKLAGRLVGALLIVQMAGSAWVNFSLEAPLFGAPGFLVNAAPHAQQVRLGALFGLAIETLWLGIAIAAWPFVSSSSRRFANGLVAFGAVVLSAAVLESVAVLTMVSLSEAYAGASAADRGPFEALRVVVAAERNWAHYVARMLDGAAAVSFFAAMYATRRLPWVLCVPGLIAAPLMIAGVAMPLFGNAVIFPMLAPLGLVQVIVAAFLLVKGFARDAVGATEGRKKPQRRRGEMGRIDADDRIPTIAGEATMFRRGRFGLFPHLRSEAGHAARDDDGRASAATRRIARTTQRYSKLSAKIGSKRSAVASTDASS